MGQIPSAKRKNHRVHRQTELLPPATGQSASKRHLKYEPAVHDVCDLLVLDSCDCTWFFDVPAKRFRCVLKGPDVEQAVEDRLRRFVADASHELRTPVTVIQGVAELWR